MSPNSSNPYCADLTEALSTPSGISSVLCALRSVFREIWWRPHQGWLGSLTFRMRCQCRPWYVRPAVRGQGFLWGLQCIPRVLWALCRKARISEVLHLLSEVLPSSLWSITRNLCSWTKYFRQCFPYELWGESSPFFNSSFWQTDTFVKYSKNELLEK